MRIQLSIVSILALLTFSFTMLNPTIVTYSVDTAKSSVVWVGEKVTGSHTGNIQLKSGGFEFADGVLTGGNFVVDMSSITDTDIADAGTNAKLVGHLKSDDFFGVAKHPTASFVITNVVSRGKTGEYKLIGDITVKGTTKEIRFNATINQDGSTVNGNAEIVLDRTDFDIRYRSGSFFEDLGDKTIYDEFTLKLTIVGASA